MQQNKLKITMKTQDKKQAPHPPHQKKKTH